ncbi:MAG: histidine kinase [Acidobacteria bacterium]|nr:histidine kinase [Acidobacteriota bacterium]
MSGTSVNERMRPVFGPGWWTGVVRGGGIVLMFGGAVPVGDGTPAGLATALILTGFVIGVGGLVAAWLYRRLATTDVRAEVHAQSFSGIGMMGAGLVVGAVAMHSANEPLMLARETAYVSWMGAAVIAALSAAQLIASTRRIILRGHGASAQVATSEREAHLAELLALQQRLEPDLLLNAISAIAARTETSPRDAERAVEGLAAYLRCSLQKPDVLDVTLQTDMQRAGEYADIMALAGVRVPIVWQIDADVMDVVIPSGTLRTFLDYALARCMRDVANAPGVKVRAYRHAGRFFLLVNDTAAPDPPMLEEPEALMALRRRLGAPPQRRVRVETHIMLEVDGTHTGTTQSLVMRLEAAA